MLQIIVATHGPLSGALIESAEMIFGELAGVSAVSLTNEGGIELFRHQLTERIEGALGAHEGVLVLCDLLSGTPWNVATGYAFQPHKAHRVAVLSGVSLPLLLLAQEYSEVADPNFVAAQLIAQVPDIVVHAIPVIHDTPEDF